MVWRRHYSCLCSLAYDIAFASPKANELISVERISKGSMVVIRVAFTFVQYVKLVLLLLTV
jgi:hypothetical protein